MSSTTPIPKRIALATPIPKRIALAAYDCLAAVFCAALLSSAFAQRAYAYVDPSVMTYTIQALAGVAVALGAVAGVAFRRTRRAIIKALHIDENAHKEVDSVVHRLDADGNPIIDRTLEPSPMGAHARAGSASKHAKPKHQSAEKDLKWPSRLWRAVLAAVFLVGTVLFVAPVEMVASNSGELIFTLADVWRPLVVTAAIAAGCLALVMSLFWKRGFDLVLAIVVALGLCFYLQALFMNQTLPLANGAAFDLSQHQAITVVSTIVWVAVVVGAIVLFARRRQLSRNLNVFVSIALIFVQGVAVASLWMGFDDLELTPEESTSEYSTAAENEEVIMSREGLYELSPANNVVVFVLDAFDVINMDGLLSYNKPAFGELTGFTYFSNSTGSLVPTRYGVPFLLTGMWPKANETWHDYVTNYYPSSTFIEDVLKQDYSLYVYTDTPGANGIEYLSTRATNVHPVNKTLVHSETVFNLDAAVKNTYVMALYREMPWLIKEPFWFSTEEVNSSSFNTETHEELVHSSDRAGSLTPYVMDDAAFYQQLQRKRLSIYDDGAKGSLHFVHLFGAHVPYTLDENAVRQPYTTSADEQCLGSLRIVSEYLRQMKELGVYDDATIIITADHGRWNFDDTIEASEWAGDMAGGPILLVKPAHAPDEELKVSEVRTGHLDFHATVIDAVGGNASKYGITVFQANDPNRIRRYCWLTHNGSEDLKVYEYAIDGEVTDWSAWSRTGVVWDCSK